MPVYKNQPQPQKTEEKPMLTSVPWTHQLNEINACAEFNAKIDQMDKKGYMYHSSIPISANSKLLIFVRK